MSARPLVRVMGLVAAVVLAALLGGATGGALGAAWTSIVTPGAGLEGLGAPIMGMFIGSAVGVLVELAAVFKVSRITNGKALAAAIVSLGLIGAIGVVLGLVSEGAFAAAPLLIACLPAALLLALATLSQRVANYA